MPQYQGVWSLQQQMQALTSGRWATDPLFDYTTLLLQADDAANSAQNNTFLDSSTNAFAITRNGNTTQGTFSPFSATGWSNYFDGSSYLSVSNNTALQLGSSDFTWEGWFYLTVNVEQTLIYSCGNNTSYAGMRLSYDNATSKFILLVSTNGTNWSIIGNTFSTTAALNTWHHVAIVRSGTTFTVYQNGLSVYSTTLSGAVFGGTNHYIGAFNATGGGATGWNYFNGYASNVRLVKGTAVYTSNFTPSTTPLTAITNTSLLTCQSNRFIDNSTNAFSITLNGSPSVQAFSPFAPQFQYTATGTGGSGYFDGTGDYLSVGSAANWTFLHNTTAAWTMEFWVYNTTTGSATTLLDTNNSTTGSTGVTVQKLSNELINVFITYSSAGNNIVTGTSTIALRANAWNHVFISYNQSLANTNLVFYINGAAAGTANKTANTPSSGNPANALSIGCYGTGAGQFFPGYISSLRISNTVRSVPSGVPTAPYTSDANTALLTNFTNAGILDGTMKNNLETVGNAQVSTSVVKYGSGSMYFDGTGDYLITPSKLADFGSGNFTVEGWVYVASTSAVRFVADSRNTGSDAGFGLYFEDSSGYKLSVYRNNALLFRASSITSANTWYHVVFVRNGTTSYLYIDGTQVASASDTNTYTQAGSFRVGAGWNNSDIMNGYIDDLRVTKGIARYTQNFIPPSVALPRQ